MSVAAPFITLKDTVQILARKTRLSYHSIDYLLAIALMITKPKRYDYLIALNIGGYERGG